MKKLLPAAVLALLPFRALAQTPDSTSTQPAQPVVEASLATPTAHEVNASVGTYTYSEPGDHTISIHGPKFGGEYGATLSLNERRLWFVRADARSVMGDTTYDGWCSPWQITPNSASPNGYQLDLGDYSPCSESGDSDWYVEARGVIGKDFIGRTWAWAPFTGLGFRHLSNGTTGVDGFRTQDYLYLPVGTTARTRVAERALSVSLEYDLLLHGWQETHNSRLGAGFVPATAVAPAFTIDGFSDVSFDQHSGWALRAGVKYQLTTRWSVEPYYVHWNVGDSSVDYMTATFTVNGVTARQQLGFYEPFNVTNEFAVKVGFRFGAE
jgi:opacity protein-like surface antigen